MAVGLLFLLIWSFREFLFLNFLSEPCMNKSQEHQGSGVVFRAWA